MFTKQQLLAQINKEIPVNINWKKGAQKYLAQHFEQQGRENIERYSMNKPFGVVGHQDPVPALRECTHYLNNFANALTLLSPKSGSRILDVACGGGWVSHLLSKMGYWTYGIDISEDFINLARERLANDATLQLDNQEAAKRFVIHDIEDAPLPSELNGSFDIIWLESCLHHFVDPVRVLEHLADVLKDDGIIVLIEYENRKGSIKEEYMSVMREFDTLERPYSRAELECALILAGMPEFEFVGTVNGWFSPFDPIVANLNLQLSQGANDMNLAICAKYKEPLAKLFPHKRIEKFLLYGNGFYQNENGFRWCQPSGEITCVKETKALRLKIHSIFPRQFGREQLISVFGLQGELGRIVLTPTNQEREIVIEDTLYPGEKITIHSSDAFRPSWQGADDKRLLSFYIETSE